MKKNLLLFIVTLATWSTVVAQFPGTGKISGSVTDAQKQPVPFATVVLLKAQDSTVVKSTLSTDSGNFTFDRLSEGQYIVTVSSVGYRKYRSATLSITADDWSIDLSQIVLELSNRSLATVNITAQKPLIEMQADKLIMNVQGSIVATGNTAFELLQKAPGVAVDQSENITLNGKSGIMIYMDGKQTYMSPSDLTNLLKNTRSDQIDKLEIISNPSAKYDAAGKAIINIVMIRNKNFGTNGSFSTGTGVTFAPISPITETPGGLTFMPAKRFPRYNTSISLNSRKGKVNVFGSLNFSNNQGSNNSISSRIVSNSLYDQYTYRYNLSNNVNYKIGSDYFVNRNTTVGILVSGNIGGFENSKPSIINGYNKTLDGSLQSQLHTSSNIHYNWANTTVNANFKHMFDTTGRALSVDVDQSFYNNHGKELGMVTLFYDASGTENSPSLNITNNIPNVYNITAGRIDYTMPMPDKKAKLEMGAKSSWVRSDNDFRYFKNDAVDVGRTNHFIYTENINALYSTVNKEFSPEWNLQLGLRMEFTRSESNSVTLNQASNRDYVNLFPSFFLKQVIDKDNELAYSYSRRIDRPAYNKLNPFIYFSDPYNYEIGNEKLKPQYTNAFSIHYTYKHSIITTLGYSSTYDYMADIYKNAKDDPKAFEKIKASTDGTNIDPAKITFLTSENLATFNVLNLGVTFPIAIANWWNMNNNFTVLYIQYKGKVSNSILDYDVVPYNFYTSQAFKLPEALSLEASMNYNSKTVYGQIKGKEQYSVNFGIRKSLWNSKANLSLSVNDIFATNRFYGTVNTTGVNYMSSNRSTSRSASVSFSYKFGNNNIKSARSRSTATDEERNRVRLGN